MLSSLAVLLRDIPLLRVAAIFQALSFGLFNTLWIGLSLRLQLAPFHLDLASIGRLSLVAVAEACVAAPFGIVVDRIGLAPTLRLSIAACIAGWALLLVWPVSMAGVVLAMVFISIGATGNDVALRSALYRLAPDIRMRLNSAYSAATFVGGSMFSLLTPLILHSFGWPIVVLITLVIAVLLLTMSFERSIRARGA